MRLAIPSAPRPVTLGQIPGARLRLARSGLWGVAVILALGAGSVLVRGAVGERRAFLRRAVATEGQVSRVRLPERIRGEGGTATLDVLYAFEGRQQSATGLSMPAELAEALGPGGRVGLLVDPDDPAHVEEQHQAQESRERSELLPWALLAGGLIAFALVGWELVRTVRSDVRPLRFGALVWLTPAAPLPDTRREIRFEASYRVEEQVRKVRARIRPGLHPVRNGDKVLAAVLSARPNWARVVDEDLARRLGWFEG